ncbi:hypothetical protein PVAND_015867 [Polypedilum vanderplanki]|uniref:Chitin-binding type-2 domain-containing protein n=1 Tax=Polypedilum vanderplanki TaxID=319348 RepID=A0A9J6BEE5_POLVA|nr:hypothetical protein PVAND_015867 [Polypedilum vanderplanki]
MKFLILCTFVTFSVAQIPTFPIFPPNLSTTTTARSNLPPMEPMVPNFPIFPPAQTTLRPGQIMDFQTYLPDTTNCRGFFICNAGYAWPMNCPPSITGNVVWSQQR